MPLIQAYQTAMAERGGAFETAMVQVDMILAKKPADARATAYKGSLLTMMGDDAFLPWTRVRKATDGINLMDEALAASAAQEFCVKQRAEIVMICGFTNSRMPRLFKRGKIARQLISELIGSPLFADLPEKCQAQAFACASLHAKSDGRLHMADDFAAKARAVEPCVAERVLNDPI